MGTYRKRPGAVEAVRWTGENGEEVGAFMGVAPPAVPKIAMLTVHDEVAHAVPGDWIVKEPVPGRFYPCKPDIFAATYDAAGDGNRVLVKAKRVQVLGTDRLTPAQFEAVRDLEKRGRGMVWEVPPGSVVVTAGDLVAVLEPEPSGLLVFDCGTGRAVDMTGAPA
jgi:hypothetical protein